MDGKIPEDVPNIGSDICNPKGEPRECYLFWALEAVLQYLGEPVDYHYLMGVLGCAFRLIVNEGMICASGPDVSAWYHYPLALEAVGYREKSFEETARQL